MKTLQKEYSLIKEYVGNLGQNPSKQILELKKSSQFETLLTMVDHCFALVKKKPQQLEKAGHTNPEYLNELVLGVFQNNPECAEQFLSGVYSNPDFLHRATHQLQNSDVSDIALTDIELKSNHELIGLIEQQMPKPVINKAATEEPSIQKLTSWFITVLAGSRVRLAFVSLVLILGISLPLLLHDNENPLYKKYFLSDCLPCEYQHSGFRSRLNTPVTENNFTTIKSQFSLAISDYMVKNYSRSLAQLEQIINEYNLNKADATNEETILYRDIYFFAGICNLALARDGYKNDYLLPSVKYIKTALNYVQQYDLKDASREYFFLAIAHDLLGNKQLALENLGRIQETSIYYIDGLNRKRQLTK